MERFLAFVITATGVMGGILGAGTTENVSLIGAGGFTFFAMTGFTLMWRTWAKENGRLSAELATEKAAHQETEWRFDLLLGVLRRSGIDVPPEVWGRNRPPHAL